MTPVLALVGTGAVARAVGEAQIRAGGRVAAVLSRDGARAAALAAPWGAVATADAARVPPCDVVLVCVPDRAVAEAGARLAGSLAADALVLHTSGALSGAALTAGLSPGAAPFRAGSLHPLQSFRARAGDASAGPASLAGVHWFHEGEGADAARSCVAAWGGAFHALAPGAKALYHAGAAVLSNHAVALFADATRLFAAAGIPPGESRPALAGLLEGTAANLRAVGAPAALTGPVERGDVATVRAHVRAIADSAPDLLESYRAMARRAVAAAREKGSIDAETAARLAAELAG